MKHIIIDTNVFARYFVRDNVSQYEEAKKIFTKIEEGKLTGRVSLLVIDELIWVLESYYDLRRDVYISQIMKVFSMKGIKIIETKKNVIMKILENMQKGNLDFTDLYLYEIKKGSEVLSFDRDIKKLMAN
ncbi:PIN domain-containing protein [Candidatus Gottesmanbacteria bacterium]|nr:PIN domain-containing protein [Candidatus Gottesmanbacteria bacterium]MBI5452621.1 PIN domain-containing protein [Candidatus Gottesmanbacteria bacterium]